MTIVKNLLSKSLKDFFKFMGSNIKSLQLITFSKMESWMSTLNKRGGNPQHFATQWFESKFMAKSCEYNNLLQGKKSSLGCGWNDN
jgi:hypothetical protein